MTQDSGQRGAVAEGAQLQRRPTAYVPGESVWTQTAGHHFGQLSI